MCFSNGRHTSPTPQHPLPLTHTQSAMAFPKLGIQCLMCFLLTMPMRKENVPCVLWPEPCLSRRRRMTCQTRNCSDLGNYFPLPLPSLCCLSVGILIIVVDREAFRGFATAYGPAAQSLGHWPCALTTGVKVMTSHIQNDTQYLCYSFLSFSLFSYPPFRR